MPSVCIVADTHKRHREIAIPPCDLLIHCGDICSFQADDARVLDDADMWFAEAPASHVICIGGNHDFMLHRREFRFSQATYLEDSLTEIAGLRIYGSPWCPDLSGFAFFASEPDLIARWRAIPSGIDILITHTPPQGILDLPSDGTTHLGCPWLRQELQRIRPRLHVFGHIHASHGQTTIDGVTYANAAVVGGPHFEVRQPATVIDLSTAPL
jgi:Icc-related predicted phosphoesterase